MGEINRQTKWVIGAVAVLLVVLEAQLPFSVAQNSQTFDESAHIYSGYSYWKTGDLGIKSEHPPLEKLVDTLPLLPTGVKAPPPLPVNFRAASFLSGNQLLYGNNADALLFRTRRSAQSEAGETRTRQALRLVGAMALASVVAITILWSFFGFRYAARPGNAAMTPATTTT